MTNQQENGPTSQAETAPLLDAVARAGRDLDLRGAKTFYDRYGRADVMLLTSRGHICANQSPDGGIEVMIWRSGDLAAWGPAADPRAVASILGLWKAGADIETLSSAATFLEFADEADTGPETKAIWRWFLDYGNDHLMPLARSSEAEPALRELLPFPSHGSLSLIRGRVARQTQEISFYRYADSERWRVDFRRHTDRNAPEALRYHTVDADDLAQAVALAAEEARSYGER